MSDAEGNQASSEPVGGTSEYAQPVFEKIVRQAVAGVQGLRLEPLEGGSLPRFLYRPRRVGVRKSEDRLTVTVPVQVEYGRRIPEMAGEAQRAISAEIHRITGEEALINLRIRGLYVVDRGSCR